MFELWPQRFQERHDCGRAPYRELGSNHLAVGRAGSDEAAHTEEIVDDRVELSEVPGATNHRAGRHGVTTETRIDRARIEPRSRRIDRLDELAVRQADDGIVEAQAAFSRMCTPHAEPRPITWARPTLAPFTWRSPASPRRWVATS